MSSTILWVTSGRGPIECQTATVSVAREIEKEASDIGLSFTSSLSESDHASQSVSITLSGIGSAAFAKKWIGTVLWTEKSARRGKSSRKNWFVGVFLGDTPKGTITLNEEDIHFDTLRAGGPGGQHQNVTESAVRAVHIPTGITAVARDERSQHRNRKAAIVRLGEAVAILEEADRAKSERNNWLGKVTVERGNPHRTYVEGVLRK